VPSYEILSDSQTRHVYDTHGMEGLSGQGTEATGLDELFEQFFGSGSGPTFSYNFGPGPKRRKGEDTTVPYDVTLEDLFNGKPVKLCMEKEIICSTCKGCVFLSRLRDTRVESMSRSGAKGSAKPKSCFKCSGKGWEFVQTQVSPSLRNTRRKL